MNADDQQPPTPDNPFGAEDSGTPGNSDQPMHPASDGQQESKSTGLDSQTFQWGNEGKSRMWKSDGTIGGGEEYYTPAWERRSEIGFSGALFKTIGEVLFNPAEAFRSVPVRGDIGGPLLFAVLLGTVGTVFQAFYQVVWIGLSLTEDFGVSDVGTRVTATIVMLVLSPVMVAIGTFLFAAILHVFLFLLVGANRPFEASFKVIAYVGGATAIFDLIPVCGFLFILVWGTVCTIIGAKQAHKTDTWRAVLAVLLPMLFCCCCLAALAAMAASVGILGAEMASQANLFEGLLR
ncbi:MAG TPA: YIP1 family protein [bacterium]|nr:YIP1 family protein [bacterium]HQL61647.1 YIP1 family protein [bacterium]